MAYGKILYREKFKQTMEYLEEIKRNYFNLDDEYQFISKRIETTIKYIEKELKDMPENGCSIRLNKILDILKGSDKSE